MDGSVLVPKQLVSVGVATFRQFLANLSYCVQFNYYKYTIFSEQDEFEQNSIFLGSRHMTGNKSSIYIKK